MTSIVDTLRSSEVFKNVEEGTLNEILSDFRSSTHHKGSAPVDAERTMHRFYIIRSGRMKVFHINPESGREYSIFILAARDIFDVLTLLENRPHEVNTEALDPLVLMSCPIDSMREHIKQCPELNAGLLPFLSKSMRDLEQSAVDIALTDTLTRLIKLILSHLDKETQEIELINDLSHAELAHLIGTTRAVINRSLQELKKDGLIDIERKHIHVKNLRELKRRLDVHATD